MRSLPKPLVISLIASFVLGTVHFVVASEPDLKEIQAGAFMWRASFINLHVIYELRTLPPINQPLVDWSPPDAESAPQFVEVEWIWADYGFDLFDDRIFYWTPGKVGYRNIDVFNGPKNVAFHASYRKPPEEPEVLKELKIQELGVGNPTSRKDRTAMRGLYWPGSAEWLWEILAKREWTVEGIEPVFGDLCVKITAEYSLRGTDKNVETLWLDIEHDFLPRRYQKPPKTSRTIGDDFVVDELQQLEGGMWFPKRTRLQLQTDPVQNQLIVLTLAEHNKPLDLSRFEPPSPITGTIVSDQRPGAVSKHGEQSKRRKDVSKSRVPVDAADGRSAVPPNSWALSWSFALIGASIALLAIGIWFRR